MTASARRVSVPFRVRLADVTDHGRFRLDAVARFLQDVAGDDVEAIQLPGRVGWILRRLEIDLDAFPRLNAAVDVETTCTGVGRSWAERTTTIRSVGAPTGITARAIWVLVDLDRGAPRVLPDEFFAAYGDEIRGHRVSARLTLPPPGGVAPATPWSFRRTDFDVYRHVNNANYWVPVEEWLAEQPGRPRPHRAEIEFGAGIDLGDRCDLRCGVGDGTASWWFEVGGEVRAAARVTLLGA